jgi:hypothetical protein
VTGRRGRNVSLLVAIGVNERGYREILGICEGREDKRRLERWVPLSQPKAKDSGHYRRRWPADGGH